jgi:histidinol-phosphate/aromatic aminotransferase/cobyric acid decarboxylase-like protein
MTDPISAATIVYLAFQEFIKTDAGKKLVESSIGKLGEKLTEGSLKQLGELRQKIWQKFRGKPEAEDAMIAVQNGADDQLQPMIQALEAEMVADPQFAAEVRQIAQQIINIETIEGRNVQQIFGGQGLQVNDPKAPVIQNKDGSITINYGVGSSG